jgi:hypothetical protein
LSRDPEGAGLRLGGRNDDSFRLKLALFAGVPEIIPMVLLLALAIMLFLPVAMK